MLMVSFADLAVRLNHKQLKPTGLQYVTLTDCSKKNPDPNIGRRLPNVSCHCLPHAISTNGIQIEIQRNRIQRGIIMLWHQRGHIDIQTRLLIGRAASGHIIWQ